jgi:hypothetical protein
VVPNQQANIHFFYGKGNDNRELGKGFFFFYIRESFQSL